MKLAILVTNTDVSKFSESRPKDGEKFTLLIQSVRPSWLCSIFSVKDNVFPKELNKFDGFIITGSPASVHDISPWISKLMNLIREIHKANKPMFGSCFGHQAIALALGGSVGQNPSGWSHGLIENKMTAVLPWAHVPPTYKLYGSHIEQVTKLPIIAKPVVTSEGCEVAGYIIERNVFTTQHHPEMSHEFITDLVEECAQYVGFDATSKARKSLEKYADGKMFSELIVLFFEWSLKQN
ncbi:MAG: GMP synthase-like glutamine amidotransferase [Paracoccaceae bacterium]|jgi:GMP synthase-like glutamine amidotransferase